MADESKPSTAQKWRGRASDTKRLLRQPSYAKEYFPRALLRAWRTRGGGWYGIGYLVTFIYLEVTMTLREIAEASSVGDFFSSQLIELIGRWLADSIMNMVQAFLWPLSLVELIGGAAGAAVLLGIHLGFEYLLRPIAEQRFPELAQDRAEKEEKKRRKQKAKSKDLPTDG